MNVKASFELQIVMSNQFSLPSHLFCTLILIFCYEHYEMEKIICKIYVRIWFRDLGSLHANHKCKT